ncbi:spermidine/spermine N(1)-acetyltransferase-like protein 1 isoform X2 [Sarcophilus harrisii]|uniref:spermidine/spermine N(1)-acetyltransferase-like protein 1 isoform X2 n=1 Tax=Sarcophilus harrisii TaxID=9305 RepID=UPI001301C0EB|nr:spermidine/spermine N(1)-acetyltransferase-like protein 1 isoform X2 [Sarcophilus harrisii]
MSTFRVRPAQARDCPDILRLIKELAAHGNNTDAVKITIIDLLKDGFGDHPLYYCLIAEVPDDAQLTGTLTVGFAMYYFTYDPWIGKLLYLEDFYVVEPFRDSNYQWLQLHELSCSHMESDIYGILHQAGGPGLIHSGRLASVPV